MTGCFGKLFNSVIIDRINSFLDASNILGIQQSSFRKGHSRMVHDFALQCLIDVKLQREEIILCVY